MEVCAANASHALPKRRWRFRSIDTVPAKATTSPNRKKDERGRIAVANEVHERPKADTRQERMPGDPDDTLWRLRETTLLGDEVGFGVVRPMTTNREAGSIRIMANGFHHSSIPHVKT